MNYLGAARKRVPLAVVALAVNAIIDIILIPKIGIVAGAIGTDVAYAIWVPAHLLILRQLIGLPLGPQCARVRARDRLGRRRVPATVALDRSGPRRTGAGLWRSRASYTPFIQAQRAIYAADINRMREVISRTFCMGSAAMNKQPSIKRAAGGHSVPVEAQLGPLHHVKEQATERADLETALARIPEAEPSSTAS